MKKNLFLLSIMISSLSALEFRVGKGEYHTDITIKNFLSHDTTNDIYVFGLREVHQDIVDSSLFFYGDAELYTSDSRRQETKFANFSNFSGFSYMPFSNTVNKVTDQFSEKITGMFPVEGDYEAVGFDLDFGLGYDVLRQGGSYLGIAVNMGASLPMISAENLSSRTSFSYDLMESWDLDVSTYKIGPALKGNIEFSPDYSLYGSFSFGFQKAEIESELFKSNLDIKGDYSSIDIGMAYQPRGGNYFFTLGHTTKRWSVDSVDVNLYNFFKFDAFTPFTTELKSSYTYMSVGYHF